MALRVEATVKFIVSNDNVPNPKDIVIQALNKGNINFSSYNEATSKVLRVAVSVTDEQVDMDNILSAAFIYMLTDSDDVSVILVPTGKVKADCSAIKLLANFPLLVGSDIKEVYVSNANATDEAVIHFGAAGN